jgi:DNA-binding MarR family transcriptional regulator
VKSSAIRQNEARPPLDTVDAYRLEEQVGYILRQVSQRHAVIFSGRIPDALTATQFAALAKLREFGPCSQNRLGRMTAMDAATIKGVTDRLIQRGLVEARIDPEDSRRRVVVPTPEGLACIRAAIPVAFDITEETLAPLTPVEREQLLDLLKKLR